MKTSRLICKSQVRVIEDVVEAWKPDYKKAMQVRDIEDLISLSVFLQHQFRSWANDLWDCASSGKRIYPQAEGEVLRDTLQRALEVMPRVLSLITWAEREGYSVDDAKKFKKALDDIAILRQDFLLRWPFVDQNQIEESRAEFERGEFQSAEDVLLELQGLDSEQD